MAEIDSNSNVVSIFVYGSRPHVPDYMFKTGAVYRIISDHLGSVRLVVNADTGEIAQRIDYDEFGNVLQDTNPGFQPFGFAGGLYDPDTALLRVGIRDYDARTGRWLTRDPALFTAGPQNLYAYCGNNPVCAIDPLGTGPGNNYPQTIEAPPPSPQELVITGTTPDAWIGPAGFVVSGLVSQFNPKLGSLLGNLANIATPFVNIAYFNIPGFIASMPGAVISGWNLGATYNYVDCPWLYLVDPALYISLWSAEQGFYYYYYQPPQWGPAAQPHLPPPPPPQGGGSGPPGMYY